jgi:hypothetical protein
MGVSEPTATPPQRIVALGASNLTRGLPALVAAARRASGSGVEVEAALGLGRSYGVQSRILVRTLPGILESGLWRALEAAPRVPTRALVTDVGNDILYGSDARQILGWVEECVSRLQRFTGDIVLTDLPLSSLRRLTPARFLFFRSFLVPRCRRSQREVMAIAEAVVDGLAGLASRRGLRFFPLRSEWYGFDPIHFRPRCWRAAWSEILEGRSDGHRDAAASMAEALRLYSLFPERQWLLGIERAAARAPLRLPRGGSVRLY